MAYHAFVAMPFGTKEEIDFNRVYGDYIKPALESAGFEVFRADKEMRAGNIRTDMFQELLVADLVVADLSIDNPNVWYELGVRHALRARGVIQIQCRRDYMPFDVSVDRMLGYHVKDGIPDPDHLEADKNSLAEFATQTMASWRGRKISPVFHLLRYLKEPDWKSLRVEEAKEFWEAYDNWARKVELARKGNRPGDILVFAEETPTRFLQVEAYRTAGVALRSLGRFSFALAQFEKALALNPDDIESQRQKGVLLGRLKRHNAAKEWLEAILEANPDDAETWALLGRVEKDAWVDAWRTGDRRIEDAACEEAVLRESIAAYVGGFRRNPGHYYSGINAVTLRHLYAHLTGNDERPEERSAMEGGVRWAVQSVLDQRPKDYWARATLAEIEVLTGDVARIERAYKEAVAVADKDWFALDSSRQQLLLLNDLGFRPAEVDAALRVLNPALEKLSPPESRWEPAQVFLFSGHMIDAPDRRDPRFPADKEKIAGSAIAARLAELKAGPDDLALCGGACGGDILFGEACLALGMRLEVRIPFDEPAFLQKSVAFAGEDWTHRYFALKGNSRTRLLRMPDELGALPKGENPFGRNNLWQLYSALAWGPEKVRFVCLWNRKGGDGPGGTEHMYETVKKHAGLVYVLDTNVLW
jgi:tetratricopeptide (TPR) repeat protein